jgi:hypothetical protein
MLECFSRCCVKTSHLELQYCLPEDCLEADALLTCTHDSNHVSGTRVVTCALSVKLLPAVFVNHQNTRKLISVRSVPLCKPGWPQLVCRR